MSALVAFLLASPLVYSVHILLLFVLDTFVGDREMLYEFFVQQARRKLVLEIVSGGLHALLPLYAVSAALLLVAMPVVRWSHRWGFAGSGVAGLTTGFVFAVLFFGGNTGAMVPFGVSGLLMGVIVGFLARRVLRFRGH